jgi:uncharacterized membrane protein
MRSSIWLKAVLLALGVTCYSVIMHLLLTSGQWPLSTLLMALLPFALLPFALLKAGHMGWSLLSAVVLIAVSTIAWEAMRQNPNLIYLLQNIALEALMAWGFGRTLRPGHEPLISQFARRLHGPDFSPIIATYTRQVTWAWTWYFVAIGMISSILFAAAPLAVWSWFINFATYILLGLMFAAEYAVRRWRLRNFPLTSFIKSVAPYWDKPVSAPAPVDSSP